jgi:hypothetical protein
MGKRRALNPAEVRVLQHQDADQARETCAELARVVVRALPVLDELLALPQPAEALTTRQRTALGFSRRDLAKALAAFLRT